MCPAPHDEPNLHSCHRCGLIQRVPAAGAAKAGARIRCTRCLTSLSTDPAARSLAWPAALALAALVLYPVAMALPILELEKLGRTRETTIWSGVVQLFSDGHMVIALIVFLCSIVIPLGKIGGILVLCLSAGRNTFFQRRHLAFTYHAIEWLGRWGMIDVLLVAILVAAVKLGDWVDVHPGPGVIAFAAVVILSMLSSIAFDPAAIWRNAPDTGSADPRPQRITGDAP